MTVEQLEILLVASVVAVACALPGVFLVLRRVALLSDAISHAILLGIVLAFFITQDLSSPWLILGASLTGLIMVALIELIQRTRLVKEDAAIGLVFPALFSLGVILISKYAGNVHLDVDSVLLGELAFAPFNRFVLAGVDMGPQALYLMGGILLINLVSLLLFFKEIKLATFDAGMAAALGFSPVAIHYALMALVSVTAVGAFDAVGSILVVALMIVPPATAYLLTQKLETMVLLSALFAVAGAVSGYGLAWALDSNIAGSMATAGGVLFAIVLFVAPERGLLAGVIRRNRQRWEFAQETLVVHILHHEGTAEAELECHRDHLLEHFTWDKTFSSGVVRRALSRQLIEENSGFLALTSQGRSLAHRSMIR